MKLLFPWQSKDYKNLLQPYLKNRLSHALILAGASGIGKFHLAELFSYRLLCEAPLENNLACGNCHGCSMLDAGTHPDRYVIQPEEKSAVIKIDQIRDLVSKIYMTSHASQYKFVIINPADSMTIAAANSLLKTLEEPPEKTLILLLSSNISSLPITIRSRCQLIHIDTPDIQHTEHWLAAQQKSDVSTKVLLALTAGAPLRALSLSEEAQLDKRDNMIEEWCQLVLNQLDPVQITAKWLKLDVEMTIKWIQGWIIDMIRINSGQMTALTNEDKQASLSTVARLIDLPQLFKILEKVDECLNLIHTQVNNQSLLEGLLIYWSYMPSMRETK